MITETGTVVAVSGERVWVQTIRGGACESCSARQGCGQRALAGISGGRANQVLVGNTLGARVGDEVTVAIHETALLGASVLVYALPLVLMMLGTLAGQAVASGHEGGAVFGAALGLMVGFMIARRAGSRKAGQYEPKLMTASPIRGDTGC